MKFCIFMKTNRLIPFIILIFLFANAIYSQDKVVVPQRVPEQEAQKQTEKMQEELNLTPEQTRQIYEINLKYARERQISNTRSAALERMKNKNTDIQQVLNEEQNNRLQSKRYEHSTYGSPDYNRSQLPAGSGLPPRTDYRTSSPATRSSFQRNVRSSFRGTVPEYQGGSQTQTRRSIPAQTPQQYDSRQSTRSYESMPARRSGTTVSPQSQYPNSPSRSSGSAPANVSPRQPDSRSGSTRR
ncbi:MAG TPA: hypothetical protein VK152_06295 [Paludibacter sp.]|nr:hypothetical protein [Paludibacter sp.]